MIDSSPSSAESSFRELDEVFLQTQTRIWLGELLNIRLNEDLSLSDLLQDGEILFEVSKVVWDFLLTKCMELRHLKHKYGPFRSKKSSGRYRPYSNVDSFLKICKILGLSGIDLFSPSDVVEKRDIRKVCICIRALSKKARSKLLSVPDFDSVIYSVTMPTDMVGVIRKSLESSQCTFSSSSSYGSRKGSQMKLKQKNLPAPSNGDDDSSSSEESDEAESRYMGENSFSSASKLEYADGLNSDLENTPETHPKLHHGISNASSEERHICKNDNVDVSDTNFSFENDDLFMGDSSCIGVGENNYISDYLAFSDLMVHATDGNNPVVLDGENNMFDFFLNVDSQKVTSDKRGSHNGSQRIYSDDEDMEVSSTTSMSSVLGRLLNLEFDNQFDEDELSSTNVHFSVPKYHESEKHCRDSFILPEPSKEDTFDDQSHTTEHLLPSQDKCEFTSMENPKGESYVTETYNPGNDFCQENKGVVVANDNEAIPYFHEVKEKGSIGTTMLGSDVPLVVPDDTNAPSSITGTTLCETMSDNHPCLSFKDMNVVQDGTHVAENGIQGKREDSQGSTEESISDEKKDTSNPQQLPSKHNRRPLLKTVAKGTAIAGVLFLLLRISKSRGNTAHKTTQNSRILTFNGSKSSSTREQTRRVGNGIYPTEKIKLGN